jgi:hypothetical protein
MPEGMRSLAGQVESGQKAAGKVMLAISPEFYADLRKSCDLAGSQSRWAEAHGLSVGYVNDVLNARKDPGPALLQAIGWRRVSTLVRIERNN